MTTSRILPAAALLGLLALLGACGQAVLFCDENTPCADPNRPFCDLTGEFPDSEGHGKTCIANPIDAGVTPMCSANETVCEADTLVSCDALGNIVEQTDCLLGCHDTDVRCNKLDPSNGLAEHLDDAEANGPDIQLGDGATFDTTTGEVRNGDGTLVAIPSVLLPAPTDGVEVRVFKVGSLTLGDTTILGNRAIALVSAGDVRVLGELEVIQGLGSGGVVSPHCEYLTYTYTGERPGGAGGGFGGQGARGGSSFGNAAPLGGLIAGLDSLVPLQGGCAGTQACLLNNGCNVICSGGTCGRPGFGGGAIQISAVSSIQVGESGFVGVISATGGGGRPDGTNPGTGGGSGGGILLEAPLIDVAVDSGITANGGGGSCLGQPGANGALEVAALGGVCSQPDGSGGRGATANQPSTIGTDASAGSGGGGGGGVGRVRINARNTINTGATISPNPSMGQVAVR